MPAAANKTRLNVLISRGAGILPGCILLWVINVTAADFSFTNSLAQAAQAEKHGGVQEALKIYARAESLEAGNSVNLCVLARHYCDLMYQTHSMSDQKNLLGRALACALQAVKADPKNSTAHACVAVCYAKSCSFADIKTRLAYSQLFKAEAEEAIKLDPKQDIAYYLLGRWNDAIGNAGLLSRAYVRVVYGGLPQAGNADAIKNFKMAIGLAPDRIIYHAGLAKVYEAAGWKKLALAELEKCRSLKPLDRDDREAQQEAAKKLNLISR